MTGEAEQLCQNG